MEEYLADQATSGRFSGVALVTRAGETVLEAAHGQARREENVPNEAGTTFQIASISKQFAAAAILLLQMRGSLSVYDKLSKWLPDIPEAWEPITLHHLLTHTSGIGHWQDFPQIDLFAPDTRENLIRTFQSGELKFPVGEQYAYSSPGYVLLADVVERASGRRYADFLADEFFHPLGMTSTGVGSAAPHPERQAFGYEGEKRLPSFDLDSVAIGAGDMWSTADDMTRWNRALAQGEVLDAAARAAMLSPHAAVPPWREGGKESHYGYGLAVGEVEGHPLISHTGGNAGFVSFSGWLPEDDLSVVVLTNDEESNFFEIAMELIKRAI